MHEQERPGGRAVRDIRGKTRKQYSLGEKIRIVVSGLSLSGFDERRSPVSLDCVRVFEQFFEHDVPPRCWEATSCPSRATEKNMFADRRSTPGITRDINVAAIYEPRQHSPPNIERRGWCS